MQIGKSESMNGTVIMSAGINSPADLNDITKPVRRIETKNSKSMALNLTR